MDQVFHGKRHPSELKEQDVESFLTHLAVSRRVSSATQAIALNALVFLYGKYLNQPLGDLGEFRHSTRQRKLPVVLTQDEVKQLINALQGIHRLMAGLLYGSGLRRIELVRLRVKDVDFDQMLLRIWHGKGAKHRLVTLAPELISGLKSQIKRVSGYLIEDKECKGYCGVWMPDALARKYPNAPYSLNWQYLFPSSKLSF